MRFGMLKISALAGLIALVLGGCGTDQSGNAARSVAGVRAAVREFSEAILKDRYNQVCALMSPGLKEELGKVPCRLAVAGESGLFLRKSAEITVEVGDHARVRLSGRDNDALVYATRKTPKALMTYTTITLRLVYRSDHWLVFYLGFNGGGPGF